MALNEAALKEAENLLKGPLEKIAIRELEKRGGVAAMRSVIRELQGLSKNTLESLATKLPAIIEIVLRGPVYRRIIQADAQLVVRLFGTASKAAQDFLLDEQVYRQQLQRLTDLVTSAAFSKLLKNPKMFQQLEKLAAVLLERQVDEIDRYAALRIESDAYNQLVQRLFPKDYPTNLRVDDHHIIEDRFYDKFKQIWKMIGWKSADDMAAIPLMYEFHIRSPRTLLPDLAATMDNEEDIKSLTGLLLDAIKVDKINSTDELLDAYEKFYKKTAIWDRVRPTLKAVREEISRQKKLLGSGKK